MSSLASFGPMRRRQRRQEKTNYGELEQKENPGLSGFILNRRHPMATTIEQEIFQQIAAKMACQKEDIIKKAISGALGTEDWHMDQLKDRISHSNRPGGFEMIFLDDKEIVEFYPIFLGEEKNSYTSTLKAIQNYKLL
jgi:hypothetical protein